MRFRIKKTPDAKFYIERRYLGFWWTPINKWGEPINHKDYITDFKNAHDIACRLISEKKQKDVIVGDYKR